MNARQVIEAESPKKALKMMAADAQSKARLHNLALIICPVQGHEHEYVDEPRNWPWPRQPDGPADPNAEVKNYYVYSMFVVDNPTISDTVRQRLDFVPERHLADLRAAFLEAPIYAAHDLYFLELQDYLKRNGVNILESVWDITQ